jgi:transcriptional regulator with XRE-family HTH domain
MPKLSPRRALASERNLARRIEHERGKRGWSYDSLAKRMTEAGYPLQGSAIYKIEKMGRRIVADEIVAFAEVFDLDIGELFVPVEVIIDARATELVQQWGKQRQHRRILDGSIERAEEQMRDYYTSNPAARPSMESLAAAVFSTIEGSPVPSEDALRVLTGEKGRTS